MVVTKATKDNSLDWLAGLDDEVAVPTAGDQFMARAIPAAKITGAAIPDANENAEPMAIKPEAQTPKEQSPKDTPSVSMARTERIADRKIVSVGAFAACREALRKEGRSVVHCHGVFDLVHPGHVAHLEEAKRMGDVLVVSVTAARFVYKGPGHPYFSDELRLRTLAALECVDYVILSEAQTAMQIIGVIKPDIFIKGKEYEPAADDLTSETYNERVQVESMGGEVRFTSGDVVFSSTKLLNNNMPVLSEEAKDYAKRALLSTSFDEVKAAVDSFAKLKVLVVGDIVIDEYVFCNIQGLMSKDQSLSTRFTREERYLGGSLAVARHLASFAGGVTVCSMVGQDERLHSQMLSELGCSMLLDLSTDPSYKTPIKRRFIQKVGSREDYRKLFSINYLLDGSEYADVDRRCFAEKLRKAVGGYDVVFVADYGHGLIDDGIMEILENRSKYLVLNCQTNSSNAGENNITKYHRADAFTLDERELKQSFHYVGTDYENALRSLFAHLGSASGWLTLGSYGALHVCGKADPLLHCPAFTQSIVDTIGAGDAFFALAGLSAASSAKPEIGTLLGNMAGALAANYLCNASSITKSWLLKSLMSFLSF